MRFLSKGRVFWNLTKSSITYQTPNAVVRLRPVNFSSSSNQNDVGDKCQTKQKQKLLQYHVLPLEETLKRFMDTVKPLLTCEEYEQQEKITKKFADEEGAELQKLLVETGCEEKNWLAHRWLKVAYLQYRDPVTVYVSPGMTFPVQNFADTQAYVDYAAKVVFGLGEFKDMVDAGKMPILKMGKHELDNSQFGKVFGTCRIPQRVTDCIVYNPCSDYVVVLFKNHFYKMQLYNCNGSLLSAKVLAKEIKKIMEMEASSPFGTPFGLLTTDTRDNWAEAYEHLVKLPGNSEAVKVIQGALFTVSLDQCMTPEPGQETNQLALQLIHGGGSKMNSSNRWMDKTVQLIINPNGMVGFTYEHSPAEGQPIAMMMDYVVKKMKEDKSFGECGATDDYKPASKLKFCPLNPCIEQWVFIAQRNIDKLVYNLQMEVLKFEGFGKDVIKKLRLGPDSFIQIALQLTFYKMHKVPAAQYESAHLRIFDEGRTETIRSCSNESVEFCRAVDECKGTDKYRGELLRKAVNSHQSYTKLALQGRGVDRHLLGLKLMAVENDLPVPKFYSSPGFVKSSHFRVSTSQVATPYDAFMGYGPATDDGYACCYNPRECDIIFAISAWRHNNITNHVKFAKTLAASLIEMKNLAEHAPPPPPPEKPKCQSKL
ncbi:carnitine O-acetyltransferase-like isoform X2 [Scaptodrosophila lebanonensis]|nr:carnitine O-acetyltransferase-like isoform X2 [Scaptodrosophila lebanonensis]XP_030377481.1 carnitine O-acetyltransferase-like isoform X2 [Scaptodrosophila lebanonensis]